MLSFLKYFTFILFLKRNKTKVIFLSIIGSTLTIFMWIMSDIKPHISDENILLYFLIKWTVFLFLVISVLWLINKKTKSVFSNSTDDKPNKNEPMEDSRNHKTVYKNKKTIHLETKGDEIKKKYVKKNNAKH